MFVKGPTLLWSDITVCSTLLLYFRVLAKNSFGRRKSFSFGRCFPFFDPTKLLSSIPTKAASLVRKRGRASFFEPSAYRRSSEAHCSHWGHNQKVVFWQLAAIGTWQRSNACATPSTIGRANANARRCRLSATCQNLRPLLNRIDIHIYFPVVKFKALSSKVSAESS
jgi:hypothetical protein